MEVKLARILLLLFFCPVIYSKVINGREETKECDGSWVKFEDNCYLFFRSKVSFHDAEDFCRYEGGHLASVHSESENEFLVQKANSQYIRRHWIGLNIFKGNSTPEWTDGSPVDYTNIVPKEYYKNEKCFIYISEKKGWRAEDCGLHNAIVCQKPVGTIPTTIPPPTTNPSVEGHCPKDWIQFGQKCYKYFGKEEKDRLKFKEARDACWSLGKDTDLVSIHSMKEQAFLTQNLQDLGTSAWIGMNKLDSDEIGHDLVFGWIDNSRADFSYWTSGHPPLGTWKYCGFLNYENIDKGYWYADYCEFNNKGYICQKPSDPTIPKPDPKPSKCDADSVEYEESCYRYFAQPLTHEKAEESCKGIGGHLVSMWNGFEQSFIYSAFSDVDVKAGFIWNGLSSVQNTQYLQWSDKYPVYYSNWIEGQPKFNGKEKVCSRLDIKNNFRWDLADCSLQLPYICEVNDEISPSFPEIIGSCATQDQIDIGDEFCYLMGPTNSWDANQRYCLSKGMKMVKIDSKHQADSLISYLWQKPKEVHLGLFRKDDDKNTYIWLDGSVPVFTNWDNREPSDGPGDTSCVSFSQKTGKWKAIACNSYGISLCQSSKIRI